MFEGRGAFWRAVWTITVDGAGKFNEEKCVATRKWSAIFTPRTEGDSKTDAIILSFMRVKFTHSSSRVKVSTTLDLLENVLRFYAILQHIKRVEAGEKRICTEKLGQKNKAFIIWHRLSWGYYLHLDQRKHRRDWYRNVRNQHIEWGSPGRQSFKISFTERITPTDISQCRG